jgi:2-phospho-L-lactate/phosphoenolpyruvate guanylyltransferase
MSPNRKLCAVVPVKDFSQAKQRLAGELSVAARKSLARTMLEDVLGALAATPEIAGILVITVDETAAALARRFGAEISAVGARDGHTGAVGAASRLLASRNLDMMAVPGDIPLVEPSDFSQLIVAHADAPSFTIVPARDELGSNAILCSAADAVPLRFGEDSFFPHLAAARAQGIEPRVVALPHIQLDIDTPDDLAILRTLRSRSRTHQLLDEWNNEESARAVRFGGRSG